jgi:hypothetical protein
MSKPLVTGKELVALRAEAADLRVTNQASLDESRRLGEEVKQLKMDNLRLSNQYDKVMRLGLMGGNGETYHDYNHMSGAGEAGDAGEAGVGRGGAGRSSRGGARSSGGGAGGSEHAHDTQRLGKQLNKQHLSQDEVGRCRLTLSDPR